MPRGTDGEIEHATVKRREVDVSGQPIGFANSNPMLDSREYKIEYLDGTIEIATANLIAENIISKVNEQGHRQILIDEIIDHKFIVKIKHELDNKRKRNEIDLRLHTENDWEFCVSWKDASPN